MPKRVSASLKACRNCHALVTEKTDICPICGSRDFSDDWSGLLIVLNIDSALGKELNISKPGRYALKVR